MQNKGKEGREAVQCALKELEANGYAALEISRGECGRVTGKGWRITEEPINGFLVHRQAVTDERLSRRTAFPTDGFPAPTNNNNSNNNLTNNTSSLKSESEIEKTEKEENGEIEPEAVEAEKENPTPQIPSAPPPGDMGRVDAATEVERMRQDTRAREAFTMSRRIPADLYDEYLNAFALEVEATQEVYYGIRSFRSHFYNWSGRRYERLGSAKLKNGKKDGPNLTKDGRLVLPKDPDRYKVLQTW
ncbi:MAG: hypothetical protein KDC70_00030 [Saprospiraceae bacterium]|nr:hypothetical protein [Saprospiraceae bacterium]